MADLKMYFYYPCVYNLFRLRITILESRRNRSAVQSEILDEKYNGTYVVKRDRNRFRMLRRVQNDSYNNNNLIFIVRY